MRAATGAVPKPKGSTCLCLRSNCIHLLRSKHLSRRDCYNAGSREATSRTVTSANSRANILVQVLAGAQKQDKQNASQAT